MWIPEGGYVLQFSGKGMTGDFGKGVWFAVQ